MILRWLFSHLFLCFTLINFIIDRDRLKYNKRYIKVNTMNSKLSLQQQIMAIKEDASTLSSSIQLIHYQQQPIIKVSHPKASALISLFGGHIISFQPTGQHERLWLSEEAIFDGQGALRGGIPICWPWFGRIHTPAHGFARNSEWEITRHSEDEHSAQLTLSLLHSEQTHAIWPHQFHLSLHITITEQLTVNLEIKNTDQSPWQCSGALHSYLRVNDIHQTEITGMGGEYIDSLQSNKRCQGETTLTLADTVDRVYTQPESTITINDRSDLQITKVTNQGHNSVVIWNPWQDGATSMKDMNNDGYQHLICAESTIHAPNSRSRHYGKPWGKLLFIYHY